MQACAEAEQWDTAVTAAGVAVGWAEPGCAVVIVAANQHGERHAGAGEVAVGPQGAHRGPGDADGEQPELPHELGAAANHHRGPLRLLAPAAAPPPKNSTQNKALTIFIYRFLLSFLKEFV